MATAPELWPHVVCDDKEHAGRTAVERCAGACVSGRVLSLRVGPAHQFPCSTRQHQQWKEGRAEGVPMAHAARRNAGATFPLLWASALARRHWRRWVGRERRLWGQRRGRLGRGRGRRDARVETRDRACGGRGAAAAHGALCEARELALVEGPPHAAGLAVTVTAAPRDVHRRVRIYPASSTDGQCTRRCVGGRTGEVVAAVAARVAALTSAAGVRCPGMCSSDATKLDVMFTPKPPSWLRWRELVHRAGVWTHTSEGFSLPARRP